MDEQRQQQESGQGQQSSPSLDGRLINNLNSKAQGAKKFHQNTKNRFARARNFARKLRGKEPLPIPGLPTSVEGAAKQVVKRTLISSPVFWVIVFIVLLILAVFFGTMSTSVPVSSDTPSPSPVPGTDTGSIPTNPIPGLDLRLDQPPPSTNNAPITLVIRAEYSQTQDVEIIAPIPPGYNFSSANGTYSSNESFISWRISQNTPLPSTGTIKTYVFTFTIIPTSAATDIVNYTVNARYATNQSNKF